MSEFNVDEYFATRSKAFTKPDGSDFINDKYLELQRTSQEKVRELAERSAIATQREVANAESWVGKQNLDPNSFQGQVVNDAANLNQGVHRVAGSVLSAAPSALAAANQANLSEDDIAALNRHQKGESTPEDLARINRKVAPIVAPTPNMPRELAQAHANERAQALADLNPNAPTPLSIWTEMNKAREISRTITESADKSAAVHMGAQTAFGADLTSTYTDNAPQIAKGWEALKNGSKLGGSADVAVGVAKLLFGGISDVAANPQATLEYMIQNAPQLLVGLAGKAGATAQLVDNVSAAADTYNKGIQDYQAKNGGALPPEDQRQYMAFMAATSAAAEQVGDKIGLAATKLGGSAVQDVSRASFKSALKGTATAVGEGILSEAPTETWQQFAEGQILGKPATGAEMFAAGVIGGASGAGLSGGGRAVHEAAKLAAQPTAAKQETIDQRKVQEDAIASGDVSNIKDPVAQIAALVGHSQKADTTPKQKEANLAKANEIVTNLEAERAKAEQATKTSTVAGVEAVIAERQAQLADPEINSDAGNVTALNSMIELAQADLAELVKSKDQKAIEQKVQKRLDTVNTQLREAKLAKDNLALLVQTPESIDADIALISAPSQEEANDTLTAGVAPRATAAGGVSQEQAAAADRIVTLAMTAPERLDTAVVAKLAADTSNALTAPQRNYLSAFLRAQQSNPALTSSLVAEDIYAGKYGNKGVVQYRTAMSKALAAGSQKKADIEMAGISKFAQAHQDKADAAAQALKLGLGTSILKEDGQWVVGAPGIAPTEEQKKAGGRPITSGRFAIGIKNEAQALSDVAAELQAAYDLKFNVPKETANVQNVSQQGSESQVKEKSAVPSKPTEKPVEQDTAVSDTRVTDDQPTGVVGTGVVEAAGVTATQAEYDEAVRVKNSSNEADYDSVPGNIASLITAMNDGTEIKISPVEKTASTEETPVSSVSTESTQSTEKTGETTELPVSQKDTTPKTPVVSTESGMTVFKQWTAEDQMPPGTKLGEVYRIINKAIAFLTQKTTQVASDEAIAKDRPLVSVQNLMARWNKNEIDPQSFFTEELSEEELNSLASFKRFANKWSADLKASFVKGSINPNQREDFLYEDPIQDFMNEDGTIDENIITAVIYATHSWLLETANRPARLEKETVLEMHGQDKEGVVTPKGMQLLGSMTAFEDVVISAIGKEVVSVLGLKAKPNAPQDYLAKVAAGFGVHGLLLLERQGLINRGTLTGGQLNTFMPGAGIQPILDKEGNPKTNKQGEMLYPTYDYIQLPRDEKLKVVGDTKTIRESAVQSRAVLDRFFGSERTPAEASWTPIPFNQATAKGTGQAISKKQRRILEKAQKVPNRIIPDMWNALQVLGDSAILAAAGFKEYDETKIQKTNRDAVLAQNENLVKQLEGAVNLVQGAIDGSPEGINQPFFANFEVWRNFRVGVTTWNMNLQSSKIHRFMFSRPGWESTIRLDDTETLDHFLVGVAQAFGIKTDAQSNVESLEKFNDHLLEKGNRTIELALLLNKSIVDPKNNLLNEGDKQAIGELAAKAEGMQTLQALVAYGHYLSALSSGKEEFTATMLVGVDGKTNGPIFSLLALGAAKSAKDLFTFVNRGGFYKAENGVNNYSAWYQQPGNQDLYQDLARELLTNLPKNQGAALAAFQVITKDLLSDGKATSAGRGIVKTPLTSFAFGSSTKTSVENMKGAFLQGIADRIQALANSEAKGLTVEDLVTSINTLIRLGGGQSTALLPVNTTLEQLMELELTDKQEAFLGSAFDQLLGETVDNGMRGYFETFIQRRNSVNRNIQTAFDIYSAIYSDLRNTELNRLMDDGLMAFDTKEGVRVSLHDLTIAQELALRERVQEILPQAHTTFTNGTDELNAGVYMASQGKGISQSPMYRIKVQLGQYLTDNGKPVITARGNQVSHLQTTGIEKTERGPGVAGLPYLMHSFDSGVMHEAIENTDTLNVHDESANGAHMVTTNAQAINHTTWNNMLRFSPATEAFQMLERSVANAVKLIESGDVSNEAVQAIRRSLASKLPVKLARATSPMDLPRVVLQQAKIQQYEANVLRLETLSEMTVIDQYTWEGGEYHVTEANRAEAKQMLEDVRKEGNRLSAETLKAAGALGVALRDGVKTKQAVQVDPVVIETNKETGDKPSFVSPFGAIGKPTANSDPELVAFFNENPKATAKQVIQFLYRKLSADTTAVNRDFNLKLLKLLSKTVPTALTINLVTADTKEEDVVGKPDDPALGWYTHRGVEEAIYLVGNDFTHSNMQVEVLLHEMTHAATQYRLTTTAGQVYHSELSHMLDVVRAYAKANGITKFDTALTNVDELVAYGMTSRAFQAFLSQVPDPGAKNKLSTALTKFVNTLASLLGFKQTSDAKALGVLLTNVTALMEQAAVEKAELESRTLSMAAPTNTYSTIDIHEALADGSLTEEFDEHLRNLLGNMVYKLHGAYGSFKASLMKNQTIDAVDVWLKALDTDVAPFASEALGHIATSPQVAYALEQVEATVRAALETNESQTKMVYKELYKLYGEAESIVTVQSLIDAGLDAATAQATHDMLFKLNKTSGNRSNYLARFAALGLAHPVINQVLQAATARDSRTAKDAKTFLERLEIIFENILRVFQTYVTRTYQGQPANDKLLSLVGQLVDIEAKYQRKIVDKASKSNYLEPLEANIKKFTDAAGAKIEEIAGSSFIRNNKNVYVQTAGALVGTVAGGRADLFMDNLFKLRAEVFKKRFGVVASLAQAYVGQNVVLQGLLRMTKLLEGDRQDQVAGWAKSSMEAYADNGKMLRGKAEDNVAARASISSVFMRTGAHNLMGDFDMNAIEQLVTNKAALDTAITSFEGKLAVHGKVANDYMNYAEALGYLKATGVAVSKFVHQNAYAISRLAGTGKESQVSTTQAEQAEATLKVLVTLYALRYSNDIAVGHAGRVIKAENARADKMNGLEFTLLLQKRLEKESLERLFGNNPMLMVHGYTSEIYDPNVSIKTANVLEGKALVEQGYVQRSVVPIDPADADQDIKHIYVLQDGGMPRFVSGAISNRGMQAKGKTIHNGYLNVYNATGIANAAQNAALVQDRQATFVEMARPGAVKALIKKGNSYLVPVFNEYGKVVNWRYMMAETTKDNILNRNNRFDKVLGTIAGSIYDKETSREQNMASVKALYEQYQTDYKNNPKSYVDISPKSDDPEMREIWNLLPEDTRKDILSVWGRKGMTVKTENLDIMFGYRKLTVGTIFQKANEERDARKLAGQRSDVMALKTIDAWQKLIVLMFESPLKGEALVKGKTMEEALKYARKAGDNAVRTEHIWQAIVSETKDIIVVKSGLVLLGNMSSNIWLLGMSGVPILDVMHHHLVAWKGAVSWQKDTEELDHLKRLRDTGYTQGNKADIDRRILRLEDALDRNPVKELVEAGLMPTIVEDVNPEDALYSYKSQLVRKVETVTDKMNPTLVKAARTAYLAHDTKIYQAMSQMTKLSDFMARYTMYQHLISKKDPLSKSEATQKVSEAFINYDIALHRSIQYTDDMGITMFTKYFIGIQKVLMDTVRENPARVLTGVLLSKFLGLGPTVLDGSMWNHIGNNPLRAGPFELIDALSELPMVNAPLALFNMGGSPAP